MPLALNMGTTNGVWATDGKGTIVAPAATGYGLVVSKDHGETWRAITIDYFLVEDHAGTPRFTFSSGPQISYANGKFFAAIASGPYACSLDGLDWHFDNMQPSLGGAGIAYLFGVYYKNGVYLNFTPTGNTTTGASTFTEDQTKIRLPDGRAMVSSAGQTPTGMAFMKIRD